MADWTRASSALIFLLPLCVACRPSSSTAGRAPDAALSPRVSPRVSSEAAPVVSGRVYAKPAAAELRQKLNRLQFEVTQKEATEPPFRNAFWDNHAPGIYVDVATGEPLFSSLDRFDSGTGWPSFSRPIEDGRVVSRSDATLGMDRTEVRSSGGGSHLGHVFDDGPAPTGQRYCINSASLRFVPQERLAAEGYGPYAARFGGIASVALPTSTGPTSTGPASTGNACAMPPPGERPGCEATLQTADLEGGPEAAASLRKVDGVLEVERGPRGARVRVTFDPARIAYPALVDQWVALGGRRDAR